MYDSRTNVLHHPVLFLGLSQKKPAGSMEARHKAFMIVASSSKSSAGKLHHVGSEISACLNPVQHKLQPRLSSSSGEGVAENLRKACRVAGLVDHDSISSRGCKSCKELRTD